MRVRIPLEGLQWHQFDICSSFDLSSLHCITCAPIRCSRVEKYRAHVYGVSSDGLCLYSFTSGWSSIRRFQSHGIEAPWSILHACRCKNYNFSYSQVSPDAVLSASKQLGLSLLCSPDHRARKVCPNRLGACTLPLRINCSACTDLPNGFKIEQAVISWRRPYSSHHYLGSSPGRSITEKKLCFLPLFFKVFQHSEISPHLGADTRIWKTVVCIFRIDHGVKNQGI